MKKTTILVKMLPVVAAIMLCCAGFNVSAQNVVPFTGSTWADLGYFINNDPSVSLGDIVELSVAPTDINSTLSIHRSVTLRSASIPVLLTMEATYSRHFNIDIGTTLILENITLDGDEISGGVDNYGIFVMNSGAVIQNCSCPGAYNHGGGGVFNRGIFDMNSGAVIQHCKDTGNPGGGVRTHGPNGIFTMYGGSIKDNESYAPAGGVAITDGSFFYMHGGDISNNISGMHSSSDASSGGGVHVVGTFNMYAGVISGNKATGDGGGGGGVNVHGSDSFFNMYGGTISDNTAFVGGGVMANGGSSFTLEGGIIRNNTADVIGGVGIVEDSHFTMEGGEVSGNTATSSMPGFDVGAGGIGIFSFDPPTAPPVTITGGKIQGNLALGGHGGGIYSNVPLDIHDNVIIGGSVNNGTPLPSGSTVGIYDNYGNKAVGNGGGIYIAGPYGTLSVYKDHYSVEIAHNTATGNGGGIFNGSTAGRIYYDLINNLHDGADFALGIYDATISGNTANGSGGGIYSDAETGTNPAVNVRIDYYTTISNNQAKGTTLNTTSPTSGDGGGAIYITNLRALKVRNNVIFSGNTAHKPYWLELTEPATTLYESNPSGTSVTISAEELITLHPLSIDNPAPYSAPPTGSWPFTYAYNNYDINYICAKESYEEKIFEVCPNDSVALVVDMDDIDGEISFQWIVNGIHVPGATDSVYKFLPHENDTVYCRVVVEADCIDTVYSLKYIIKLLTPPEPPVAPAVCGVTAGTINVTVTAPLGDYLYAINGGTFQDSPSFTVSEGEYKITVQDANGCTSTGTFFKTCCVPPTLDLDNLDPDPICSTDHVSITGEFGGGATQVTLTILSGEGTLSATNTSDNPFDIKYTPHADDAGKTIRIEVATDAAAPCTAVVKTVTFNVRPKPMAPKLKSKM